MDIVQLLIGIGVLLTGLAAAVVAIRLRQRLGDFPERTEYRAATAALDPGDRRRIRRAVGKGRAVDDPRLRWPAAAQARYQRIYLERYRAARLPVLVAGGAALLLASGVLRLSTADSPLQRVAGSALALGALVNLPASWLFRRSERLAAAAERANGAPLP